MKTGNAKLNRIHSLYPIKEESVVKQQQYLSIPYNNGYRVLSIDEIMYLESSSNYTNIYLEDGSKLLCSKTLKYFEDKLPTSYFFRTHRSFIVQKSKVSFISLNPFFVEVSGKEVPVSRSKTNEVKSLFGL